MLPVLLFLLLLPYSAAAEAEESDALDVEEVAATEAEEPAALDAEEVAATEAEDGTFRTVPGTVQSYMYAWSVYGSAFGPKDALRRKDQNRPGYAFRVQFLCLHRRRSGSGEMFGLERMMEALNACADGSPDDILQKVKSAVDDFVGDAEPFDDLTMMCLEYKGRGGPSV